MISVDNILKILDRIPMWKKLTEIPTKVDELEKRLEKLEASNAPDKEFEECRGALFKRKAGGGWQNAVYCPNCKTSTQQFPSPTGSIIFACGNQNCSWGSMFTVAELPEVMKDLPN